LQKGRFGGLFAFRCAGIYNHLNVPDPDSPLMQVLRRFFNIKPGEGRPVLTLTLYYFFIMAASITGRSVSNGLFFARVDNAESIFPLMLIPVTIVATLTVSAYSRLARRINLVTLLITTGAFFAATLVALRLFIDNDAALILLYIWMEVINIILFFQFYIFAGTIFDTRQAKRVFGTLGVGGALAGILSGVVLRPITNRFGSETVVLLTVTFIVLSLGTIWLARVYMRKTTASAASDDKDQPIKLNTYLKTLAIVLAATILVATTVDYQYKLLAKRAISSADELTAFYGEISAIVGVLQVVLRLFFVSRLLTRFGILAGLITLPLAIGLGSLGVLLAPILLSATILKGADQSLRFTLNETSMELLWVPIPAQRKLAIKPFINGTVPSVMQGVTGIVIFALVSLFPQSDVAVLSVLVLGVVALWIPLTLQLRRGYVAELMSSIQQRALELEDLNLDETDATIVATIDRSLQSKEEIEQAFTLGLIEKLPLTPWSRTLQGLFQNGSYPIRQKLLEIAADYPDIISSDELRQLIEGEPHSLTDEAIIAAGKRNLLDVLPLLEKHLTSTMPEVKAAAARAILTMQQGSIEQAQDTLRAMLDGANAAENATALSTLSALPTTVASSVVHESVLRDMLNNQSTRARRVVLEMVINPGYWAKEKPADNETIVSIAYNLRKPSTQPLAEQVLKNYPDEHVVEVLGALLRDKGTQLPLRAGIIGSLRQYPTPAVVMTILQHMDLTHQAVFTAAVDSLLAIARDHPHDAETLKTLHEQLAQVARAIYSAYGLLDQITTDEPLLEEIIRDRIELLLPVLLKLSIMDVPHTQIESIIENLRPPQASTIANVLEILDNVLSRSEREIIIPLFEGRPVTELARLAQRHFPDLAPSLAQSVSGYILSTNPWHSLVGLDFALRNHEDALLQSLNWSRVPDFPANRELVSRYLLANGSGLREKIPQARFPSHYWRDDMYSTLEKTILLKGVVLFKDIDAREIYHIAQITEEEHFKPGQPLFSEGDSGESLYIVVAGRVRIHKGNQELAVFDKGETLGEMALFDSLPRSASATALEETAVLKIAGDKFYELMATRMEIMQGIVKTLSLRLRHATQQVTELMTQH
jgi:AAA family ATP:ADP antiporter